MSYPARFWHRLEDGRLQCDLCPRECKLHPGQRAYCLVRRREGEQLVLESYGRSSGFCVDPIEKKPLHHFHPGSRVLSFGTLGCNLGCRFCQNFHLSRASELNTLWEEATPEQIAQKARERGCRSVAFTYNEPVISAEYAMDAALACRELGVKAVAVTAGYILDQPRRQLFATMDAANVDLKAFREDFYRRLSLGSLRPVLETLEYLARETQLWLEVTTLLIPGYNDSEAELSRMCEWMAERLGPAVPLHLGAFRPAYQMMEVPPTPLATLRRARELARGAGLKFVYTGNARDPEGEATRCPGCGERLIRRDGYRILEYRLTAGGGCPACGEPLPGRFDCAPGVGP